MLLKYATWPEVESYLNVNKGIILPIGSTEQHGPSGLIGTDSLTAEVIAQKVGENTGSLVAPTLSYGMARHHMAFTGTITLQPKTLVNVIRDILISLAHHGFERIFIINGHGGNVNSVKTAFSETYQELEIGDRVVERGPDYLARNIQFEIHNWWAGEKTSTLRKSLYGNKEGYHATPSEIAVTWHAFPEEVREISLEPLENPIGGYQSPEEFRNLFPDGRMASDPSLANPEDGEKLVQFAVDELSCLYRKFVLGNLTS